jgi:hypothetical protein
MSWDRAEKLAKTPLLAREREIASDRDRGRTGSFRDALADLHDGFA